MAERLQKVVCTRMLEDHWREQALQENILLDCHDFLAIQILPPDAIREAFRQNKLPLVFTSVHAVRALAAFEERYPEELSMKDCYCIEGRTSDEAGRLGFRVLGSGRDALSLAQQIIDSGCLALLHCSSEGRRTELGTTLTKAGVDLDYCEVYTKSVVPKRIASPDALMFFSPSQVDAFLELNPLDENTPAFCIGDTTAGHLSDKGFRQVFIAARPNTESILKTLYQHFRQG